MDCGLLGLEFGRFYEVWGSRDFLGLVVQLTGSTRIWLVVWRPGTNQTMGLGKFGVGVGFERDRLKSQGILLDGMGLGCVWHSTKKI